MSVLRHRSLGVGVHQRDMGGQILVVLLVVTIPDNPDDVKPGEQCGGEVNVLHGGAGAVPPPVLWVTGGEHCSAAVHCGDNPRLCETNGLLLHHLVQRGAIAFVHLIELVNTTHSFVGENQRTGLEHVFPGDGVADHGGGEPYPRASHSGGEHAPGGDARDPL